MADGRGDRTEYVKRELAKMSIPEEYEVARVLAASGFKTQQGRAYTGSDGKPREIDVVAEVPSDLIRDGAEALLRVWLVAEVKHTDDHPWAMMHSGGRLAPREIAAAALATSNVRAAILRPDSTDLPWFFDQLNRPVGHSLVVVGGREDAAFAALSRSLTVNAIDNLAPACRPCNSSKGALTLGKGPGMWWPSSWGAAWWPFGRGR